MSFTREVLDRWVSEGVGTIGIDLFQSSRSVNPADGKKSFLVIINTGGSGALRNHNDTPIERPSATAIAHAPTYPLAEALLKKAYDALGGAKGLHNFYLGTIFYQSLVPRQHFVDLELDDARRARVAFNIDAVKEPS